MPRKTLEEEINDFLDVWDCKKFTKFLRDLFPIYELYNVEEDFDWVQEAVGGDEEETRVIRLIRTAYLMSKISDQYASTMCVAKGRHGSLYKRMEKEGIVQLED